MSFRIEHDTMGEVKVPADKLWAAQTQRSLENFKIGTEKMPVELIHAFAHLKKSLALVNNDLGKLDNVKKDAIIKACDEILANKHNDEFPLAIWQTGSGTQTNMNLNEVIANLATKLSGMDFTKEKIVHPNDHVNMSQSSNDTFPTAMHIVAVLETERTLIPALEILEKTLDKKAKEFENIIKIGRTHLQDATPLTLGQEFSGYVYMLQSSKRHILKALEDVRELTIGGTAVGTGINAHPELSEKVSAKLSELLGTKFISSPNKFHGLTSHDALVFLHGAFKALAANLMKIANDIRWLASGPRCGLGELSIPENEPGSSIMPGKVNPTQSEALTMLSVQVMGNDAAIGFAASQGNFELNVFKPVIIYNFLQSLRLLADGMISFNDNCAIGITPNIDKITHNLNNSLMLVTALNPHIGYENAAKVAKNAHKKGISLKESCLELGLVSEEDFDKFVVPANMIKPK
ncbi:MULTISPECIES: class II fumarate hydratase [unclassified Campylobacter]|uniref:class II fumarate hydratase n=1 Tax=unclassified Campylobacter TaxID=2593542 RepID=UPI001BDAD0DE|nr:MULTISPECIES: class II fumarate hydratase [unclassified Campylobacter]MBT0879796.1 class II fumarate hydratase [Campylobacter sp. 2018MI27]MBT0885162.1 class II fumarate hydratase [Campylobacter sp. 2018MI10]MBZ7982188.1 class II fumarate hydratase [Campylobacter sp. RM12640]MBZ7989361.1 class II fumarate hydratase [Campylobacter sp. RM12635]